MDVAQQEALPETAPTVVSEMSRNLLRADEHTNIILREDFKWRSEHSKRDAFCKKYNVLASPRDFYSWETHFDVDEVEKFRTIFQVRERFSTDSPDEPLIGIFPSDTPDTPPWPNEPPLLYWQDSRNCCGFHSPNHLVTKDGEQIGYSELSKRTRKRLSLFNADGDELYVVARRPYDVSPDCICLGMLGLNTFVSADKVAIYREKEAVGLIYKAQKNMPDNCTQCCQLENWIAASLPETDSLEEKLLLLREVVIQGRRMAK